MLSIFRRSLETGVVTTAYPDVPEAAPIAYRGQVVLELARCTGDGACATVCPSQAITLTVGDVGDWTWKLDDARCVFCGLCQDACPEQALRLSNEYELAVRHADDLITRVTFQPANGGCGPCNQ